MKRGSKILLVDDEPYIVEILKFLLEKEGFKTVSAENGVEANKLITQHTFSLIVCDLSMPLMDGLTLLKNLRSQKNYLPFIFLSGNADRRDEHEMANFGIYKFVEKPDFESVRKAVLEFESASENDELKEFMELLNNTRIKVA